MSGACTAVREADQWALYFCRRHNHHFSCHCSHFSRKSKKENIGILDLFGGFFYTHFSMQLYMCSCFSENFIRNTVLTQESASYCCASSVHEGNWLFKQNWSVLLGPQCQLLLLWLLWPSFFPFVMYIWLESTHLFIYKKEKQLLFGCGPKDLWSLSVCLMPYLCMRTVILICFIMA